MRSRVRHLAALVLVAATAAGCATTSDQASKLALAALETQPPHVTTKPAKPAALCVKSLRPPATLPAPGRMPAGSSMAQIQRRGYLRAGVNPGALGFGYYNPIRGKIEGFEVDLVNELAKAIFGDANPSHVSLVALSGSQREQFVQQGKVDIVVDVATMTCSRSRDVAFSAAYYNAKQQVLVPKKSGVNSINDLAGKRVCATVSTTPIWVMQHLSHPPDVFPHGAVSPGAPQAIDCLVLLQQGQIAGISTDSSLLQGFQAQDPNTHIVGPAIAAVPYGMEINKANTDFVRFVNGVLAELERNGTWQRLQKYWLGQFGQLEPPPPPQYDG
jgi:polar amino acid transport system substrate-binding protein